MGEGAFQQLTVAKGVTERLLENPEVCTHVFTLMCPHSCIRAQGLR
jgi:hypothetical protein